MSYDPTSNLTHHPTPMERFGQNPYGENCFRIVYAPSRRNIVYGEWLNGERKASWTATYPSVGDKWIMEKWLSPFEFAGCSREEWDATLTVLGSYPDRGEYELCHVFEACGPDDANLDKLVSWISEHRSFQENSVACYKEYEQEQASISAEMQDRIGNCLPAFGVAPLVGYGGGRGTKTVPVLLSAQEAKLPTMPKRGRNGQLSRSTLIAT